MDCREVQEAILESYDEGHAEGTREMQAHLAACPACAGFAARQKTLDTRLGGMLPPPEVSPGFRAALRKRVRREAMQVWADSLPDKVHFASCGLATVLCAIWMPFDATAVLAAGAVATVATYFLQTGVRNFFEDADDHGA